MAFVLSSISGNPISAASAGYAPTNSSDVSAIASAYASGKADSSALSSYALSSDVSGVIDTVSSNSASWGGGATGDYVEKSATEVAIGNGNRASSYSFAQGYSSLASSQSFAQGSYNSSYGDGFAQGYNNRASSYAFAQGSANSASSQSFAQGSKNIASSCSFAQGVYNTASQNSFAQGSGNKAYNTAAVFGTYNLCGDGDTATGDSAAFAIGDGTAYNARHDLMLVTKDGEITMFSSTADTVGTGIMSSIRAISAAATGGGVDSATVSSIASSYAESAASSKMDSSAMTSYALSADVSGTVDLVSTQSANWGGSALALSAGPGVKLEKVGDTLVASTDETVLWSGVSSISATPTIPLSEACTNFYYMAIYGCSYPSWSEIEIAKLLPNGKPGTSEASVCISNLGGGGDALRFNQCQLKWSTPTELSVTSPKQFSLTTGATSTATSPTTITRIIGINRTAGV